MTADQRWQSSAVLLSLLLHGILIWILQGIFLPKLTIPSEVAKHPHPFTLKRVEVMPRTKLSVDGPSGLTFDPNPNQSLAPDPSRQATQMVQALQSAVVGNPPPAPNLAAPALAEAPEIGPLPESTYNLSERAVLEANVARFQASNTKSLTTLAPPLPASLPGDGQGGVNGNPIPGPGVEKGKGGSVPGFEEIAPSFRPPDAAGLHGKLPEPILLQLPGDILFDFNASSLKPEADPLIREALRMIQKYPRATVDIAGHTDTIGDESSNQTLSEARAQAVSTRLKQTLASADYSIRTRGFGKTRPVVNPNGNAEEQSRNRRVEIIIQALAQPE